MNAAVSRFRIPSIDIFRLVCAVMIVSIHTHPLSEISSAAGHFASEIFPRIGVPFFFAISGYFYIRALLQGKSCIRSILHTLFIYSAWSAVYFCIYVYDGLTGGESMRHILKHILFSYFFAGSYYHFWFFPALLFSMMLFAIAHKAKAIKLCVFISAVLYIIGCLGCAYYRVGNAIPFISDLINIKHFTEIRRVFFMGLPFFSTGYTVNYIIEKCGKTTSQTSLKMAGLFVVLWMSEIALIERLGIGKNLILTLFLYPMTAFVIVALIKNPISGAEKYAARSRFEANFMYYSHPILIIAFRFIAKTIFKVEVGPTVLFISVVSSSIIVGGILWKINNRLINALVI